MMNKRIFLLQKRCFFDRFLNKCSISMYISTHFNKVDYGKTTENWVRILSLGR